MCGQPMGSRQKRSCDSWWVCTPPPKKTSRHHRHGCCPIQDRPNRHPYAPEIPQRRLRILSPTPPLLHRRGRGRRRRRRCSCARHGRRPIPRSVRLLAAGPHFPILLLSLPLRGRPWTCWLLGRWRWRGRGLAQAGVDEEEVDQPAEGRGQRGGLLRVGSDCGVCVHVCVCVDGGRLIDDFSTV